MNEQIVSVQINWLPTLPLCLDDGRGDYNRSYEQYENNDIDYADYSTDHKDNNYRNFEKKKRNRTDKEIVEDILKRWD